MSNAYAFICYYHPFSPMFWCPPPFLPSIYAGVSLTYNALQTSHPRIHSEITHQCPTARVYRLIIIIFLTFSISTSSLILAEVLQPLLSHPPNSYTMSSLTLWITRLLLFSLLWTPSSSITTFERCSAGGCSHDWWCA